MPLAEPVMPVHLKHYRDGYPLCWNEDQMGTFDGSFNEAEITCKECISYMKE